MRDGGQSGRRQAQGSEGAIRGVHSLPMKRRAYARLLIPGALSAAALAQTPPCVGVNDANLSLTGVYTRYRPGAPNTWAYLHRPASTITVRSARILTGNPFRGGFMKLAIYSHDRVSGLPGTRIAGGAWSVRISMERRWQGTNFDAPVVMQQGQPYWLVWTEVGQSALSYEPKSATTTSTRVEWRSGSPVWTAMYDANVKYRLYCGYLDDVGVTPFGLACAGSSGRLGTAFLNQPASVPNLFFRIEGTGLPKNELGALIVGVDGSFRPIPLGSLGLPGCSLNSDVLLVIWAQTGGGSVASPSVAGHVSVALPVPPDPRLIGFLVAWQFAVADSGASQAIPVVFTNALRTTFY